MSGPSEVWALLKSGEPAIMFVSANRARAFDLARTLRRTGGRIWIQAAGAPASPLVYRPFVRKDRTKERVK